MIQRTATLYGTLTGELWQPGAIGAMPVTVNLRREAAGRARGEAARFVNAKGSGLVDAIRATVDGAGDFRAARLTAGSCVIIEHRRLGPPDGRIRYRARRVDVTDLPSLADYVATDVYAPSWED
jgi:hypothetical protein